MSEPYYHQDLCPKCRKPMAYINTAPSPVIPQKEAQTYLCQSCQIIVTITIITEREKKQRDQT